MHRHFQIGAWAGCLLMISMTSRPQPLHELVGHFFPHM